MSSLSGVNWGQNGNGVYSSVSRVPFRILSGPAAAGDYASLTIKEIPADSAGNIESFVGDMVSADFNLDIGAIDGVGIPFKTDAVYFGTTDGPGFTINAGTGKDEWGAENIFG